MLRFPLISSILFLFAVAVFAVIPPERLIDWQAGIPGGIPEIA